MPVGDSIESDYGSEFDFSHGHHGLHRSARHIDFKQHAYL